MGIDKSEWIKQSDYDFETATFMYSGGRYFYAVFMCHLALEKCLKALHALKTGEIPPKSHNLVYFLNKLDLQPPKQIAMFMVKIKRAS